MSFNTIISLDICIISAWENINLHKSNMTLDSSQGICHVSILLTSDLKNIYWNPYQLQTASRRWQTLSGIIVIKKGGLRVNTYCWPMIWICILKPLPIRNCLQQRNHSYRIYIFFKKTINIYILVWIYPLYTNTTSFLVAICRKVSWTHRYNWDMIWYDMIFQSIYNLLFDHYVNMSLMLPS